MAQTAEVLTTCGTGPALTAGGTPRPLFQNTTGQLCTAASGGGGGAATIADGADVAEGAKADAAWVSGSGSVIAVLKNIASTPLLAGTNVIGKVGIDQTTPGTTNLVAATGAVASGAADSGNPIKIGGVYRSPTSLTLGTRNDLLLGSFGQLAVVPLDSSGVTMIQANNADAVGAQFTQATVGFNYGYNGTTWDRLQVDASKNLKVIVNAALPAGTAVIGHVIADTGSTTAVTGNVAETAADGSNVTLGAKADAKSTATDTTSITVMQVLKEISAMEQAPASRAVTNAGTFATQDTQAGTWTVQPGNTANTTAWLVNGNTTAADAATLTNGLRSNSLHMIYNGATADMAREVANGTNTVGTGIPAAGLLAQFDDASQVAPTENQWVNVRANFDHSLLVNTPNFLPNSTTGTAVMETATSGNVANATAAATLAAAANRTTMITGLHMTAAGATAAAAVNCTITGLITGTQTFTFVFSTLNAYTQRDIYFNPPVPASATNTTIVASCPAGGSGAANAAMNVEGILF